MKNDDFYRLFLRKRSLLIIQIKISMPKIFHILIILLVFHIGTSKLHAAAYPQATDAAAIVKDSLQYKIYNLDAFRYVTTTLTTFKKLNDGWQSLRSTNYIKRGAITQIIFKILNGNNALFGFSTNPSNLYQQYPGQTQNSWGYYCYDGNKNLRGTGNIPYGPKCGTGDTIKIVFNLQQNSSGTVQYFLNGNSLGLAYGGLLGLKNDIYLAVAVYYANEVIQLLEYNEIVGN